MHDDPLPTPPGGASAPASSIWPRIDVVTPGVLRVSLPQVRGWAVVARTPHELARAIAAAFGEARYAGYLAQRRVRHPLDRATEPVPGDPMAPPRPPRRRVPVTVPVTGYGAAAVHRPDTAGPAQWQPLPDGRWQSPGGKHYGPHTQMVARVIARRHAAGLPTSFTHQQEMSA